jgi:hypothetical protein
MPTQETLHHDIDSAEIPDAPEELLGLWVRDSITLGDGSVDRTTRVWWNQTRKAFVDLRIPAGRAIIRQPRGDVLLPPSVLESLGRQKGFAGHIVVEGARCRWIRSIDFQPQTDRPDEAIIWIEGEMLYEEGSAGSVVGSSYREIYRRLSKADRHCISLRLVERESLNLGGHHADQAILVIVDETFMFAKRRPQQLVGTESLSDYLAKANNMDEVQAYLDCEISMGVIGRTWEDWIVQHSTLPWREGQPLGIGGAPIVQSGRIVIHGSSETQIWRIDESNLPREELVGLFGKRNE